jgi:2-methylcitrate dehydratase PrpD
VSAQTSAAARLAAAAASESSISQTIAAFATNLRYEDLPERLRDFARYHILDVVGTALAATRFEFAHRALSGLCALPEPGNATVIGMPVRLPMRDAVLMNGILAHGLDYDDTHTGAIVHPTSSVFPASLGLAELLDRHGRDLITAYVLGVEIATRVGVTAAGAMHSAGFHTTGIAGHLGCAVAAGSLYRLGERAMWMAQGLGGSTASALSEHRADGAWNKRMHPGWAGVGGITAATLARGGYVGTRRIYEGEDGLFRSHTGARFPELDLGEMTQGLGETWRTEEVAIKPFPICHLLHACADSAIALRRKHDLEPEDIADVRALLHPETFHYVCEPAAMRRRPTSEYMAKFSVQYVVAACLVRGRFGFAELEAEALNDPTILAVAQKVNHDNDPDSAFPRYFSGGVVIRTRDGRTLTHMEKINRGNGDRALTGDEIAAKFLENAGMAVSPGRAGEIRDRVLELDRISVRELASCLSGC